VAQLFLSLDELPLHCARAILKECAEHIHGIKLLDLILRYGVEDLRLKLFPGIFSNGEILPVFADLKVLDTKLAVRSTIQAMVDYGIEYVTVHPDPMVVETACRIAEKSSTKIIVVTVLTTDTAIGQANWQEHDRRVAERADIALRYDAYGVTCAVSDLSELRKRFAAKLRYVTPGIRERLDDPHEHKAPADPEKAVREGSDMLVVGRPIREPRVGVAPADAARSIRLEMQKGERH